VIELRASRHRGSHAPALVGEEPLSWDQAARLATNLGAHLAGHRRVAARLACDTPSVLLVLACLERGIELAPLHPRLTSAETERTLGRLRADHVLASAPPLSELRDLPDAVPSGPGTDGAFVVSTSGSSAEPKGVLLSRAALVASARAAAANVPLGPADRTLACLPLAHVGGLSIVTRALVSGSSIVLVPEFDPGRVLAAISSERVTRASFVPTMLARLLDVDRGELSSPGAILVGGAACPSSVLETCAARGVRALPTYGLTEMASQVATRRPGTTSRGVGPPLPGVDVAIRSGRIHVRGPMRMSGYDGADPVFDDEGFFDTQDLGELAGDGSLVVLGRADDVIVTGGENVSPSEVEAALVASGAALEAAVVGEPDATWGQRVVAFVVPRRPDFDPDRDLAAALAELASFKRPRMIRVRSALPRLASGKVDRAALRRERG